MGNNKSVLQKYLHIEFFSRNCSAIFSRNIIMKNNHPNKVLSSWRNLSLLLHTKQQSMYSNLVTLVNRLKLNLHVYTRSKNKFWQKKPVSQPFEILRFICFFLKYYFWYSTEYSTSPNLLYNVPLNMMSKSTVLNSQALLLLINDETSSRHTELKK